MRNLCSVALLIALLGTGCASLRARNAPIDRIDLETGYRPHLIHRAHQMGDVTMILSFSGGGTRAAALAYGVLEELRDTQVTIDGQQKRLLDEVDAISSVSGGSFTAAYYGLFGDRIFEDYEERFLKRNVERDLFLRMLWPQNFFRLMTSFFDRTELTVQYYDEEIFDGARFSDLARAGGPMIQINATDLSAGSQFTFVQPQFDLLCSDLSPLKVALAVTASSAVPVVFPAITLRNDAGSCGYEQPAWFAEALANRKQQPRRYHAAAEMSAYLDRKATPYVHLIDGGIADNLGVRGPLNSVMLHGGIMQRMAELGVTGPHHLVFIALDASTTPDRSFVLVPGAPSLSALLGAVTDTQLHRYNFETMALLRNAMQRFAADLSAEGPAVTAHLVHVAEYEIEDPAERKFFDDVPTSLSLDPETVDRLVAIGRSLLRESDAFQNLLAELQGEHHEEPHSRRSPEQSWAMAQ